MGYHRYEIRTTTWSCPSCHHTVKKETVNEALNTCLYLFFPIGIIVWCIRRIKEHYNNTECTSSGEEIINCTNCGKKVVITQGYNSGTRLLLTEEILLDIIMPSLIELSKLGIEYKHLNNSFPKNSESLNLIFKHKLSNSKIPLQICHINEQLVIKFKNESITYSNQNLFNIIYNNFEEEINKSKLSSNNSNKDTIIYAREIIKEAGEASDNWNNTINFYNSLIKKLIEEDNIHRKTDLLVNGLEILSEMFYESKSQNNISAGAANLNAIVHFRIFLDCVLLVDNDIMIVNDIYVLSRSTGVIRSDTHNFIKLMVRISDLLDRAIVYIYDNHETDTKDYFPILETKIKNYLIEYTDDNTKWNMV